MCAELPRLTLSTSVELVIHRDEAKKPTNTGILATHCLTRSSVTVVGAGREVPSRPDLGERVPLLLTHESGAEILTADHRSSKGVALFVPDGTWRSASKMARRLPWLVDAQRVTLPVGPTGYRIRSDNQVGGLATIEAIARALGILEDDTVRAELERAFRIMVDRTLFSRGWIGRNEVFGGIADGVKRHRPGG